MYVDSMDNPIDVGDRVLFRSSEYTIREFHPGKGRWECAAITFEEVQHVDEVADECSVNKVTVVWRNVT